MPECTILYTTDLHNRLSVDAAQQIRDLKRSLPQALLLDAGDAVGAGNMWYRAGGEPILRLMTRTGYDAMAMGNRESHPTFRILKEKLRDAHFPILAANLTLRRTVPRVVADRIDRELPDGLVVGVFGLAPEITPPDSWWGKVTDYVFDDPIKTATGLARKMREECDLVVCLAHLGPEYDERLGAVPGIDVIIAGHAHLEQAEPRRVGDALLVRGGAYGRALGRLDLEVADGKIVAAHGEIIRLDGGARRCAKE
jgi:5'-nucleotidase